MAKAKQKTEPPELILEYDLYSLPSAQHKAGLAGLLLMIDSMETRRKAGDKAMTHVPEVLECTATGAKFRFTSRSMQTLLDDLFDATWEEVEVRSKWPDAKLKRTVDREVKTRDGKTKKEKRYVYDQVVPAARFLQALYPDGNGAWVKLWRNMLWSTLRGKPTTRGVYNERADGRKSSRGKTDWLALQKSAVSRLKGSEVLDDIVGSMFIGAQNVNAEQVPFQGTVEANFLLNFWPIPSLVFAPRRFSVKGEFEDAGYVVAVPEPAHLKDFVEEARDLLRRLDPAVFGYRPRAALIDVPDEGGLEYLYHLSRARVKRKEISYSLSAVEVYHLEKRGNNVKLWAANRIEPETAILTEYESLRQDCRNPLFKYSRIANLLAGGRWHDGMMSPFSSFPWEMFIRNHEKTPRIASFFGLDARRKFAALERSLAEGGKDMNEEQKDDQLARRIYSLIRAYVNQRTEEKSRIKYDDFRNSKDAKGHVQYPQPYREAREKVCSDAFLAMRGRRERDFIEYFAGTICSVPQWLPEDDFIAVSQVLATDWERVKTLSMLALSAQSYLGGGKDEGDKK
jgi:CRISPR-associated protein Cmx8